MQRWRAGLGSVAASTVVLGAILSGPAAGPLAPTAALSCGSWPLVGHDLSNTRSAAGGPSTSQVPGLQVRWRFHATDGDFTGTPVIGDCHVFVGSNGGVVRALNEQTGGVLWSTNIGAPDPSSLALDEAEGVVFAAGARVGSPFVAALDASTGAVKWSTAVSAQPDSDAYGSPLFVAGVPAPAATGGTSPRNLVFEGVASSLSSETGSSTDTNQGQLVALDAASGTVVWSLSTVPAGDNGGAIWSTPSYDPSTNMLYVGTGNAYSGTAAPTTDSVLAVDASTGAIVNHFQATRGDVFGASSLTGPDFDFGAAPNLLSVNGTPAVGVGQKSGVYWMLSRSTLQPIWSATIGRGSAFGGVVGSTAIDGSRVYGPNTLPGYTWAVDQSSGQLAWVDPSVDPLHYGPATVSNGVVYTEDSYGFLDCVEAATGLLLNRLPLNGASDLQAGSYAEAYGGVSIDSVGGLVFADTGSQSTAGDVIALSAPSLLPY
jgi:polyvinyl alcohol dehydrogenase (cytochrome)